MSLLSTFYNFTQQNNVQIIPYSIGFVPAATVKDGIDYAIFLDFNQIKSVSQLNSIVAHEEGHYATGALHKVDSPLDLISKHEYKANRWAVEKYLPFHELNAAMLNGYTETWQLAEYFNVTEDFIKWATDYYTGPCEMKFGATK